MPLGATAVYTPSGDGGAATIAQIRAALMGAADIAAQIVLAESTMIVPVLTGDLQASGATIPATDDGASITAGVEYTMFYAGYVEFGTGRRGAEAGGGGPPAEGSWFDPNWAGMSPQPYLRPALDTARGEIVSAFQDIFVGVSGAVPGESGFVSLAE